MKFKKLLVYAVLVSLFIPYLKAQEDLVNEIGITAGPMIWESDYKNTSRIDFNNIGFGVGIVHYFNFTQMRRNYFNGHFKIRNELDYIRTKMKNHGISNNNSLEAKKQRSMHGMIENFEVGTHLEWYPFGIGPFQNGSDKWTAYLSLGIHFVKYMPTIKSDLSGNFGSASITPSEFLAPPNEEPYVSLGNETTYAIAGSLGFRYKLTSKSDLQIDFRLTYYGSDFIEGLNPNPDSLLHDTSAWVNLGYIYYVD